VKSFRFVVRLCSTVLIYYKKIGIPNINVCACAFFIIYFATTPLVCMRARVSVCVWGGLRWWRIHNIIIYIYIYVFECVYILYRWLTLNAF
jgi:hypothetical protein